MQLPCPCCGEPKANVTVCLEPSAEGGHEFTCQECNADFTEHDVRAFVAKWTKALDWLGTMPTNQDLEAEASAAVEDAA
jgi:uncharacterized protein YfaQ (DUF2300 family)